MKQARVIIVNKLGLHARAAGKFVNLAKTFDCTVELGSTETQLIDGKSIMNVMMLAAAKGTELMLRTEGADEVEAVAALEALIADRFGEDV